MAARTTPSQEHLKMVDAMVSGGMSLDEVLAACSKKDGVLSGIKLAVEKRRAEKEVQSHETAQPAGAISGPSERRTETSADLEATLIV